MNHLSKCLPDPVPQKAHIKKFTADKSTSVHCASDLTKSIYLMERSHYI